MIMVSSSSSKIYLNFSFIFLYLKMSLTSWCMCRPNKYGKVVTNIKPGTKVTRCFHSNEHLQSRTYSVIMIERMNQNVILTVLYLTFPNINAQQSKYATNSVVINVINKSHCHDSIASCVCSKSSSLSGILMMVISIGMYVYLTQFLIYDM